MRTHRLRQLRSLVGVVAICLCNACVGNGVGVPNPEQDPTAVPKTYDEIQTMVFDPLCAAACHRGGAAPKGLSLEPNRSLRSLVGVYSSEVPELMRVAPGQAEESYLVVKIKSFDPRRVGGRMPRNGPPYVSSRQVTAIKRWINAGASEKWIDKDEPDGGVDAGTTEVDGGEPIDGGEITDAATPDASDAGSAFFNAPAHRGAPRHELLT